MKDEDTDSLLEEEIVTEEVEVQSDDEAEEVEDELEQALLEKEVSKEEYPTYEEIISLNIRKRGGDEAARKELITRNLGLARWCALRKLGSTNHPNYDDAYQDCCIGLMKAVERFDHSLGSLATYANWWMKQVMRRAHYNTGKTIRVSVHSQKAIRQIQDVALQLQGELRRRPTIEEIAKVANMSVKKVAKLFLIPMGTASLDAEMNGQDGDGDEFITIVADSKAQSPAYVATLMDDAMIAAEQLEDVQDHILHSPQETTAETNLRIFGSRYGIFGCTSGEKTLEMVGEEFGVTRERVRQICAKVFRLRSKQDLPITTELELKVAISNLRASIEILDPEKVSPRLLWIAGIVNGNIRVNGHKPEKPDNSVAGILGRLKVLAGEIAKDQVEKDGLVIIAASRDYNIPENEACFTLAANSEFTQNVSEDKLNTLRSRYTLSILCTDPIAIWERQGKLFPSQIPEAKRVLCELKERKHNAEQSIRALTGVPNVFREALLARYGINGSEASEPSDKVFAEVTDIRVQAVTQVLRNLWGNIQKSAGQNPVASDEEYLTVKNHIEYWTFLLSAEN